MKSIYTLLIGLLGISLCSQVIAQNQKKEVGNLVMENIPDIPEELKDRLNQYQNARGAFPYGWSADGKGILMSTRFGETTQVHYIDHPRGARKQLTFYKEPVGDAWFCPDPSVNGFMFGKDVGGNEFSQLYWFDMNTGSATMISDGSRSQNVGLTWSDDGKQFIYVSTKRNLKDYDLYLASLSNPKEVKMILDKGGSWGVLDWSKDGGKVLVQNYISANKSFIHVLDLGTGNLTLVNDSKDDIAYGSAKWNADASGFFYASDQGSEFSTLKYYDVKTKKSTDVSNSIPWDVDALISSKDRSTLIFSTNENGIYKLYKLDAATKKFTALEGLPTALLVPSEFHPDGKSFVFMVNSPKTPSDVFTYDLTSNKITQWTESEVGGLNSSKFVSPTLIEYETFDKVDGKPRKIPAFYYKPENAKGKLPVIIEIHGGPEGQSVPYFSPFRSFLTNELGIAVIEPNVRGSSGYGKSFLKLDNGFKREESVQDIGKLIEWIAQQPELDASRICVKGGSYGGYMTLASMVHFNDKIRCGVDIVGISNFVTFLQNTENYRKDLRRVEYGDERDPTMKEHLERISPTNSVQKITKPLFIVQGLNDPRVPASEAEQMKQKMQDSGREVWYLLAKDEGHGFRKKENRSFEQLATVLFLQKYLLN